MRTKGRRFEEGWAAAPRVARLKATGDTRMKTDDLPEESAAEASRPGPVGGRSGFVAGVLFGAALGAGLALLLAPGRGEKTRGRLRRRMDSWREDAREGIERAGSLTREELRRGKRRFRAELARAKERAERALD